MLKNEQIGEIFKQKKEEAKAERPWNKVTQYLLGGLKSEDSSSRLPQSEGAPDNQNKPGVLEALNAKALEDAQSKEASAPGQLDAMAENAESAAKQSARSWTSWFTGR